MLSLGFSCLPIEVSLVAEPDQEFPRLLFVDLLVARGEVVPPVTRHTFTIEGGSILLAAFAPLGEHLEAGRAYGLPHGLLASIGAEETCQPPYLLVGTFQQVLVAYLGVVRSEQGRAVLGGLAHPRVPAPGRPTQPLLGKHARLQELLRVFAVGLASFELSWFQDLDPALVRGAVPHVVQHGDGLIPTVSDDVDDLGLGIDSADLLDEIRAKQRRLVADQLLIGLAEFLHKEVLGRKTGQVVEVFGGVAFPGPDGTLDPQSEVLGVEQRVIEGTGQGPRALGVEVCPPPVGGEKPPFALAQYLGMSVQRPHQPGGARLPQPRNEEHRGVWNPGPEELPPRPTTLSTRWFAGLRSIQLDFGRAFAQAREGLCQRGHPLKARPEPSCGPLEARNPRLQVDEQARVSPEP